jgi:uncharacterized LabA/DUF88 family protein
MKRVIAVVDGLNLYHALRDQSKHETNLDIDAAVRRLIHRTTEQLVAVRYFSAIVAHLSEAARVAQAEYIAQLQQSGVTVTLGNFKRKTLKCPKCGEPYFKHEEKETDVNIALAIVSTATTHEADKMLIFSADTDLLPAIRMAQDLAPNLEIRIVSTVAYLRNVYASIVTKVEGKIELTPELVSTHQFGRTKN